MTEERQPDRPAPSVLDRLFAGGSIAAFAVLMSSVGEAVYLYLR